MASRRCRTDFQHFPYVNPDAPKGGRITYARVGTFDNLNPFIFQGDHRARPVRRGIRHLVFELLMQRIADEAFTLYRLLAESVETDDDAPSSSSPSTRARNSPTASRSRRRTSSSPMELLRDKGRPLYPGWIKTVAKMEKVGEHGVRFTFNDKADRELPAAAGAAADPPRARHDARPSTSRRCEPLIGSGPYIVDKVRAGRAHHLPPQPDYWAKDLPSKRGFDNYDRIVVDYFRDANTHVRGLQEGAVLRHPDRARTRAMGDRLRLPGGRRTAASSRTTFQTGCLPACTALSSTRGGDVFKDRARRAAPVDLFDFEWANKNLFSGAYTRTRSYFDGSALASTGVPADDREKALLAPFPSAVIPEIMAGTWTPSKSDGSGRDREFLKNGLDALAAAGYTLEGGKMLDPTGQPLAFEILLNGTSGQALATAGSVHWPVSASR